MSNIFEKFYPRLCEVAHWIALPFAVTNVSIVEVLRAPANFSFSDFNPLITGTAR